MYTIWIICIIATVSRSVLSEAAVDSTAQEGDLRLVDGPAANEGRLEILHDGQWGTVCHDEFYYGINANIVCRQLGYQPTDAETFRSAKYGQGSGPIWLDYLNCDRTDMRLDACYRAEWGPGNCDHSEDVSVKCLGEKLQPSEGDIRIEHFGDTWPYVGQLLIYHGGQWGAICHETFTWDSARVACKELGLTGGQPILQGVVELEGVPVLVDGFRCTGSEERLVDCDHDAWGKAACDVKTDIMDETTYKGGLMCDGPAK